jgi:ankyrin repeat protein
MKKLVSVLLFAALIVSCHIGAQAPAKSLDDQLKTAVTDSGTDGDNAEIVRSLLDRGGHIELALDYGRTPLIAASDKNLPKIARLLVERGANIEARDKSEATPLMWAVISNRADTVRMLLDHGANVNARSKNGNTALLEIRSAQVAKLLLERGARADDKNLNGRTALMQAAMMSADAVQLLLDHGAKVNESASNGFTALIASAFFCRSDVLSVLLDHGADVHAATKDGNTALIFAAGNTGATEAEIVTYITMLLNKGAAIDAAINNGGSDNDGQTALIRAAAAGNTGIIKLLLDRGANPDIADKKSNTSLSLVTKKNLPDAIALLGPARSLRISLEKTSWKNPQEQFDAYRDACLQYPGNTILSKKLLELAAGLSASPPVPDEARQYLLQAAQKMKVASTPDALRTPITLLRKAVEIAPWWPNAYYNLSVALELDEKYNEAETQLNYYLLVKPDDAQARTRLKVIHTEMEAAAQAKP